MIKSAWMPLNLGQYTLIDADFQHLFESHAWYCKFMGTKRNRPVVYRQERVGPKQHKTVYLHRVIMNAPSERVVDHINHDTLDNRRCNLRVCTTQQNNMNRSGGLRWKGVYFLAGRNPTNHYWQARINLRSNDKRIAKSLGVFKDPLDAAIAYNNAAREYYGEYACLNDLSLPPPSIPARYL